MVTWLLVYLIVAVACDIVVYVRLVQRVHVLETTLRDCYRASEPPLTSDDVKRLVDPRLEKIRLVMMSQFSDIIYKESSRVNRLVETTAQNLRAQIERR